MALVKPLVLISSEEAIKVKGDPPDGTYVSERKTWPLPVLNSFKGIRRALGFFEIRRRETEEEYEADWALHVRLTADELDGGWVAEAVELPGCVSQGETKAEAIENLLDAINGVLRAKLQDRVQFDSDDDSPNESIAITV